MVSYMVQARSVVNNAKNTHTHKLTVEGMRLWLLFVSVRTVCKINELNEEVYTTIVRTCSVPDTAA